MLFPEPALEAPFASPEQRKFIKAGPAVAKFASKEKHAQCHVISIVSGISNRTSNLRCKLWGQRLVGVYEKHPLIRQGQRVHCPLPLFRPTSPVMELHNVCPVRLRNLYSRIGALRIDYVDFARALQ